jgi:hypothetical protein
MARETSPTSGCHYDAGARKLAVFSSIYDDGAEDAGHRSGAANMFLSAIIDPERRQYEW